MFRQATLSNVSRSNLLRSYYYGVFVLHPNKQHLLCALDPVAPTSNQTGSISEKSQREAFSLCFVYNHIRTAITYSAQNNVAISIRQPPNPILRKHDIAQLRHSTTPLAARPCCPWALLVTITEKSPVFFSAGFSPQDIPVVSSNLPPGLTHSESVVNNIDSHNTVASASASASTDTNPNAPPPTTDALRQATATFAAPALLLQAPTFNLASSAPTQPPAWSLGPGSVSAVPTPQPQATPTRVNGNAANAATLSNAHANATPTHSMSGLSSMTSPVVTNLAPPPEGIYRSFDDLLSAVQRVAKDNGYGIVKLRASNYRDAKPTRYDLVCDRGGVKYSSTAKKRNPSTRKVDCPFRAKAVCEVSLSNQWRFVVQEARHNHEARIPAATPGQESTPMVQNLRNMSTKMDRVALDVSQGFQELNSRFTELIDKMDARLSALEERTKGIQNMEHRLNNVEARLGAIEARGLDMPLVDDVESRMLSSGVM